MTQSIIHFGNARFTLLSSGLVRMEHCPSAQFEDRPSIRAAARPARQPFSKVAMTGNQLQLESELFSLSYTDDNQGFHADNLKVVDAEGKPVWQPGQVDTQNLGGVHQAMDCIQRGVIPDGVHPATDAYHENSEKHHLWRYLFDNTIAADPDSHYDGNALTIEQLIARKDPEHLNEEIQELLAERNKYPPGLLSSAGYFLYNDSDTPIINDSNWIEERTIKQTDYYLFVYGKNTRTALADYRLLFKPTPLLPRYSLGLWFSRYPTFNQTETETMIGEFRNHELPIDVFVFDLEWHQRGWYGFDWDLNHFQQPHEFIKNLHDNDIFCAFNVHPDGIPVDDSQFNTFINQAGLSERGLAEKESQIFHNFDTAVKQQATAFIEVLHKPIEAYGVDFWWIDGAGSNPSTTLGNQFWTNEVYYQAQLEREKQRPMICSRTAGIGSHRYPFHFTGDTYAQFEVLASQVDYTIRAGHIGQSYLTHDIGGHMSPHRHIDSELLCRWYQFGAMSPIFRLHSSGGSERLPWLYGNRVIESLQSSMYFRMTLLPYLYSSAYESHRSGMPICRSNAVMHPSWEEGLRIWDAYYLGEDIYCTPIISAGGYRHVTLPEGQWYCGLSHKKEVSDGKKSLFLLNADNAPPPHFIRAGALILRQPYTQRARQQPTEIDITYYPGNGDSHCSLYLDDGISQAYSEGESTLIELQLTAQSKTKFAMKLSRNNEKFGNEIQYRLVIASEHSWSVSSENFFAISETQTHDRNTMKQTIQVINLPVGLDYWVLSQTE